MHSDKMGILTVCSQTRCGSLLFFPSTTILWSGNSSLRKMPRSPDLRLQTSSSAGTGWRHAYPYWGQVSNRWFTSMLSCFQDLREWINSLSSVQLCSGIWLSAIPWTAAHQASLSITNSQSLLKLMSIESVMPSNHLILCFPLLLQPSIFLSIRVYSNESVLHTRYPKYWSFSFSISSSNE